MASKPIPAAALMPSDKHPIPEASLLPSMNSDLDQFSYSLEHRQLMQVARTEISDHLEEWISESKSVNILIAGKTGTGKSTLINAIIGKTVTKEGDKLCSETGLVESFQLQVDDVLVNIYDSPGLEDVSSHADNEKYIDDIKANCSNIDLFLYCIRMSETRLTKNCYDFCAIRTLSKALGIDIWKNCLIVLTFANQVMSMMTGKPNPSESYRTYYEHFKRKLTKFLEEEIKVESAITSDIAIACAGHQNEPLLPSICTEVPGDCHWLSYLWLKALYKTKLNAQPALVKINVHRIKTEDYFSDEKQQAQTEVTDFAPIMIHQKGKVAGRVVGDETLGLEVGDTTSGQVVSKMKRSLGMKDSESSDILRVILSIIVLSEGQMMY